MALWLILYSLEENEYIVYICDVSFYDVSGRYNIKNELLLYFIVHVFFYTDKLSYVSDDLNIIHLELEEYYNKYKQKNRSLILKLRIKSKKVLVSLLKDLLNKLGG